DKLVIHTTSGPGLFKGFELICQTLSIIEDTGTSVEWRVAGLTDSDRVCRLGRKSLGKKYPRASLRLLGKLDADALLERLMEASIYVLPSHIENSPNSLCEAMMLGMPCITTSVGGVSSLIEDGTDGILVPDGDPWSLAGAILEIHRSPDEAVRM